MGRAVSAVVGSIALAACSLTTSFDGLSSGADADGGLPDGAPGDGGTPDAKAEVVAPIGGEGVVVAPADGLTWAAGASQQTHLHYAVHDKTWVYFSFQANATTALSTRLSKDFVTWTDGPSLMLPHAHGNDGRNLDVTYADLGTDVF